MILTRAFYNRPVTVVARELLGKILITTVDNIRTEGRIVETEAYLHRRDPACHGHRGPTPRCQVMFGEPGFAYVYPIHAKCCFNVVTQMPGEASAVLIRAIEPTGGMKTMQTRRRTDRMLDLARGPARLCQALGITLIDNGHDLTMGERIWIEADPQPDFADFVVKTTHRIGVTSARRRRLRFVIRNHPFASGPRKLNA